MAFEKGNFDKEFLVWLAFSLLKQRCARVEKNKSESFKIS